MDNVVTLAHEVGHAWGLLNQRFDFEGTSLRAENAMRTIRTRTDEFAEPEP